MNRNLIFLLAFLLTSLSMTCKKKSVPAALEEVEELPPKKEEVITHTKTYRGDVPFPPDNPWWTINPNSLDDCQKRVWGYLKKMYPINEDDYWNYQIYSLMDEPTDIFENRDLISQNLHFFLDTLSLDMLRDSTINCSGVDSTFFIQALGQPTCTSRNVNTGNTNFFYYFKLQYRHGACPYIFDEGGDYEYKCYPLHFQYCAHMKMIFSGETGKLQYIDFHGSG